MQITKIISDGVKRTVFAQSDDGMTTIRSYPSNTPDAAIKADFCPSKPVPRRRKTRKSKEG